jgi:hypothetical protein
MLLTPLQNYAYEISLKNVKGASLMPRTLTQGENHPINIGANVYGLAACLAFLRLIFIFEIHYRLSPRVSSDNLYLI